MKNHEQKKPLDSVYWLQERQRSGNWFDIADNDVIPLDIEGLGVAVTVIRVALAVLLPQQYLGYDG